MAKPAERRSALAEVYSPGTYGAATPDGPGVTLAERRGLTLVHLAGEAATLNEGVRKATGHDLPITPNTVIGDDRGGALWLAPDRWLIVSAREESERLERRLAAGIGSAGAATDVSSGRTVVRIGGANARDLLAKGCPLDLHPRAFAAGHCAQSLIAQVNVLLHAVDESRVDLYVARGFGLTMWEWLTDAAAEFGCRINAPEG